MALASAAQGWEGDRVSLPPLGRGRVCGARRREERGKEGQWEEASRQAVKKEGKCNRNLLVLE